MTREARFARRALVAAGAALAALGITATSALADDWGQRVPGRHVYDQAGVLTSAQVTDLEAAAARVGQAGAPTIVYLRLKDANQAAATLDARDLMDVWSVESAAGARDGFVLLLDLRPADPKHGSAALVAGAHHASTGRLTDGRLQQIFDGPMTPHLASGDLAGALSVALADVADDLSTAPPPPSAPPPPQSASAGTIAVDLLGGGALIAVVLGVIVVVARSLGSGGGGSPTNRRGTGGQPWYFDNDGGSSSSSSNSGSTFTGGDGGASSGSSSGGGSF